MKEREISFCDICLGCYYGEDSFLYIKRVIFWLLVIISFKREKVLRKKLDKGIFEEVKLKKS